METRLEGKEEKKNKLGLRCAKLGKRFRMSGCEEILVCFD